ncbi:U3 small nucleolar RNA-associated protein 10, partial [Lecanoromycetidae sp. Uapishka_2]
MLRASYESANAEMGEDCDQSRVGALNLIAKQVGTKECFAALMRTWPCAMTEGPSAAKEYLDILRLAIDCKPKSMVAKHSEVLGELLLQLFDLRRIQSSTGTEHSYDPAKINEVEDSINECAIAMIYKLNDATFRPIFLRILEWATTPSRKGDNGVLERQTTWYTFLIKFFDTLKVKPRSLYRVSYAKTLLQSIVTSYAGFIIEDSVKILSAISTTDKESMQLWRRVVLTLHKTFENDQDDFFQNPTHFNPISAALISQLAHADQVSLLPELIPAIAELAVATDSPAHHQEMNTAILGFMRSPVPQVRLAAVQCEKVLTEKLGEEWLALLPEMLPFISEALEDDDEEVERAVHSLVGRIEEILGESLTPMLQ